MPDRTQSETPDLKKPRRKGDPNSFAHRVRGWWEASDAWEVCYMAAMPPVLTAGFFQASLGVPLHLRGFVFVAMTYYVGSFFLVLLMIDRRSDMDRRMRGMGGVKKRLNEVAERRAALQEREAARERSAEALRRGQAKAAGRAAEE